MLSSSCCCVVLQKWLEALTCSPGIRCPPPDKSVLFRKIVFVCEFPHLSLCPLSATPRLSAAGRSVAARPARRADARFAVQRAPQGAWMWNRAKFKPAQKPLQWDWFTIQSFLQFLLRGAHLSRNCVSCGDRRKVGSGRATHRVNIVLKIICNGVSDHAIMSVDLKPNLSPLIETNIRRQTVVTALYVFVVSTTSICTQYCDRSHNTREDGTLLPAPPSQTAVATGGFPSKDL